MKNLTLSEIFVICNKRFDEAIQERDFAKAELIQQIKTDLYEATYNTKYKPIAS